MKLKTKQAMIRTQPLVPLVNSADKAVARRNQGKSLNDIVEELNEKYKGDPIIIRVAREAERIRNVNLAISELLSFVADQEARFQKSQDQSGDLPAESWIFDLNGLKKISGLLERTLHTVTCKTCGAFQDSSHMLKCICPPMEPETK